MCEVVVCVYLEKGSHFVLAIANDSGDADKIDTVYVYDSYGRLKNARVARRLLDNYFAPSAYEIQFPEPHNTFLQDASDHTSCGVYVLMMTWFLCSLSHSICDSREFLRQFRRIVLNVTIKVSSNHPSPHIPNTHLQECRNRLLEFLEHKDDNTQPVPPVTWVSTCSFQLLLLCCAQEPVDVIDVSIDDRTGEDDEEDEDDGDSEGDEDDEVEGIDKYFIPKVPCNYGTECLILWS